MLGVKTYSKEYIDSCRAKVRRDVDALAIAPKSSDLESAFLANLVVVLDAMFVHRLRTVEGKDGNPMNEVRVIVQSLFEHGGVFTPDKGIKLTPEKSVLGLREGDPVRLSTAQFEKLADAYLSEIGRKFGG